MTELPLLQGRCMYIWKLQEVLEVEMSIDNFVAKAQKAKLRSVWIKVAEGGYRFRNITDQMKNVFEEVRDKLDKKGIEVWGWHVPHCRTMADASQEAGLVADLSAELKLAGILMDCEAGNQFFRGDGRTAETYARTLRTSLEGKGKGLAISSHDIPTNFPNFPFDSFAKYAMVNVPQVYYGGSRSVESRLDQAIAANSHLSIPFVPVGAGWVGKAGGCVTAAACAEKAVAFMRLVRKHGFAGYSFWHWGGAPSKLWEVLFTEPV